MTKHLLLTLLLALPLTASADDTQGATNKTAETATELTQGETITYNDVRDDGLYFYWKFTTTETGTIRLIVKRTNIKRQKVFGGDTTTQLYYTNPDGTVVKLTEIENSDTLTLENAKPGQYYVRTYFGLLKSCTYTLTYDFTPGSTTPDDGGEMVDRKFLVVETKDHVKTTYMLSRKPEVTFVGNTLRIVSWDVDVTYNLLDVLRFTYETKSVTGVTELREDPATIGYEDGQLVISGIKAGAPVGIYSLDGKLVKQLTAERSGSFRISLTSLPQGMYIVKADNITYKIMKR